MNHKETKALIQKMRREGYPSVETLLESHFNINELEDAGITFRGYTIYVRTTEKGKKRIQVKDVIYYYSHDARNITSGCRSLGEIHGDWRLIDQIAKLCLEIYKVLKRNQLVREAKKYDMQPKGW